ncbi:fibrillin-1 isoform X5 [Hydra vulgaris]|uniref:fibrillin-1 isoform X5 n=1 Tax=Hydra vulgaris TaxID=6087 RepID=UPI0032EA30C1
MKSLVFVLQHLLFYNFFIEITPQFAITNVWYSSFETNESDSWSVTNDNNPFQRVLYSSINGIVSSQDGNWAISAEGINCELLLPQLAYYGGTITVTFYANSPLPTVLTVRFLKINLELLQIYDVSITKSGWNMYSLSLSNVQHPAFLVSFLYRGGYQMYMDSVNIDIDGKIISCPILNTASHCGFTTETFSNYGWVFSDTAAVWNTTLGYLYLKTNFIYLGGSVTGSMNFRAAKSTVRATIEISVYQTSYSQKISSGYTDFDLTASTQYTVGQTYTLLISFFTTTIAAQLSSISMSVAGKCNLCHPVLTCNIFTNGITCACSPFSCLSPNTQCIVSTIDPSINPCSCLPGYNTDSSGNCIDINECQSSSPPCSWSNGVCTNTDGSFICSCKSGWKMGQNNSSCVDINECDSSSPPCSWSNGVCLNTNGSFICSCKNGWMMGQDNVSCVDINECKSSSPPCSWSNGVCTNTDGSFICSCKSGWKMDQNNSSCADINECDSSSPPCSWSNGVCLNTNGSYICSCKNGWMMGQDNVSCVDINECDGSSPQCSWSNGVCTNTGGSFICSCKSGWKMGQNNSSCVDINECDSSSPPCSWSNGVCTNTNGSFICSCKSGWKMGQDNTSCVDINECQSSSPPCSWSNGVCSNTNGSFICSCKNGWKMGQDNASCWDINECESFAPPCSWSNGVCTNTNGSYICSCKSGWKIGQDNASCVDINECISMPLPCSWSNGVCINTNGSYFCSCKNEWRLGQDNASCVDKCNNTCVYTYSNGVYTNLCNGISSSLINTTLLNCFDVSECIKENNCSWNEGVCTNSLGSFKCLCKNEWVLKKTSCTAPSTIFSSVFKSSVKVKYIPFKDTVVFKFVEVFICRLKNLFDVINLSKCYAALQFNPSITNIVSLGTGNPKTSRKRRDVAYDNSPLNDGEIYAIFFRGYTSDGQNFTSPYSQPLLVVDPSSPCGPIDCFSYKNQTCSEVNSTYAKCYCKNGFISFDNLVTCEDINECNTLVQPCFWSNEVCINTNGSYLCTCDNGWLLAQDNASCVDINECERFTSLCSWSNGACINTNGSYFCSCKNGWAMGQDNSSCVDINECQSSAPPCSWRNGVCTNTNGNYLCSCMNGWKMGQDNASCADINECQSSSPPCSWSNGVCLNTNGSYLCSCIVGWAMGLGNASCVDINECQSSSPPCSWSNGVCTNTNGSYLCSCKNGWKIGQDNASCVDINECQNSAPPCSWSNGVCTNTNGSYLCSCKVGWKMGQDNASCVDINECDSSSPPCSWSNGVCSNTNGSFICSCKNGWKMGQDNASCVDINECQNSAPPCSWSNGVCTNTNGNYLCSCKNGWKMGQDNASCVDINECQSSGPPCSWSNGVCTNTNGSYLCSCKDGWTMGPDNASCVDINECQSSSPPCSWSNGVCSNTNGSYLCSCKNGWKIGQDNASCVDINECQSSAPPCSWSNGVCINTNGSYICSCKNGWKMGQDNVSCVDNNECLSSAPPCSWSNGVCTNTNGSYLCSCKDGWTMGLDNASCVDINECNSMSPPCTWSNGICINTNGSYFCSCKNEWRLGQDNASCVDKCNNTCVYTYSNGIYTNLCNDANGSLINTTLFKCFDVSECIKNNNCSWNEGICTNSMGSFKCSCHNEWELGKNNNSCEAPSTIFSSVSMGSFKVKYVPFIEDVVFEFVVVYICRLNSPTDEINLDNCYPALQFNPYTTTTISLGTGNPKTSRKRRAVTYDNSPLKEGEVYAIFFRGYTSDGQNYSSPYSKPLLVIDSTSPCVPIDCHSYKNQTCSLVNSTYAKCYCKNGFISFDNLVTCEDINECLSVSNVCYKNSQCTNLIGSFMCSCIDGYKFKDYSNGCVDINECETSCNTSNTTCINTIGSYECRCNIAGSFYNTTLGLCQDLNECSSTKPCDSVRGICYNQDIFETGKPYSCSCPSGWELSKDGNNSCVDINECLTLCSGVNAFCINTVGSYKCSCAVGFSLNASSQCQLNNCSCPLNSKCAVNGTINGNFGCTCDFGYSPNYMSNCEVIDQCEGTKNCMKPHQFCQNVYSNFSFICLCRDGYQKVGDECIAINVSVCNQSSKNNISLCSFNQQCFDTKSSYECRCLTGYEKTESGQCQDINECEGNVLACQPNADCINTNGSYYCKCKEGFVGTNVSNTTMMLCYTTSVWSSWEQIGVCSERCSTNKNQGRLKFQRFCEAIDFSNCNGDFFKQEMCNSEFCDNKIEILKSIDCQKWPYMQANLISQTVLNNETWLKKLRTWGGWKAKTCGQLLTDASKIVNQDIEIIVKEIKLLLDDRNTLQKVIDCNTSNQQKNSLQRQYIAIYSRLTMYRAIKATLSKLKSRIDVKLNECTRQLTMFGSYASM